MRRGRRSPPIVPEATPTATPTKVGPTPTVTDAPGQTIPGTVAPTATATATALPVLHTIDFGWAAGGDLGAQTEVDDVTVSVRTTKPYDVVDGVLFLRTGVTQGETRVSLFFVPPVEDLRLAVQDMDARNGDLLSGFSRSPEMVEGLVWDGQNVRPGGNNQVGALVWLGVTAVISFDAKTDAGKIELAEIEFTTR